MSITLKQAILRREKKLSRRAKLLKTLALDVNGQFKDNIGKDRITPKTEKKTGKTLYDKGLGQKSIVTIIKGDKLITGNSRFYMQYHLDNGEDRKKLPIRNWLMTPPDLEETMQAFIRNFMEI